MKSTIKLTTIVAISTPIVSLSCSQETMPNLNHIKNYNEYNFNDLISYEVNSSNELIVNTHLDDFYITNFMDVIGSFQEYWLRGIKPSYDNEYVVLDQIPFLDFWNSRYAEWKPSEIKNPNLMVYWEIQHSIIEMATEIILNSSEDFSSVKINDSSVNWIGKNLDEFLNDPFEENLNSFLRLKNTFVKYSTLTSIKLNDKIKNLSMLLIHCFFEEAMNNINNSSAKSSIAKQLDKYEYVESIHVNSDDIVVTFDNHRYTATQHIYNKSDVSINEFYADGTKHIIIDIDEFWTGLALGKGKAVFSNISEVTEISQITNIRKSNIFTNGFSNGRINPIQVLGNDGQINEFTYYEGNGSDILEGWYSYNPNDSNESLNKRFYPAVVSDDGIYDLTFPLWTNPPKEPINERFAADYMNSKLYFTEETFWNGAVEKINSKIRIVDDLNFKTINQKTYSLTWNDVIRVNLNLLIDENVSINKNIFNTNNRTINLYDYREDIKRKTTYLNLLY